MKKTPLSEYYWLGMRVSYLQDAQKNYPIHGEGGTLDNLDAFLSSLVDFGFAVTSNAAAAQGLTEFYYELRGQAARTTLSAEQARRLRELMEIVCVTLEAEIAEFEAFVVSPKRIGVTELLENVPALFAPGVFDELPEIACYGFSEAGKCIAFERPTAAAFHILRASEIVLQHFYGSLVRQKRARALDWDSIVQDLRKRPKTRKHEALYTHLDNIRASFKNPAQDPAAVYDIHEVQDLWMLCVEAVNRMMKILGSRRG